MQSATNLHKQRFHPCLDELACTHLAHMPFMWWIDFELIPLIVQPISRVGNGLLSWLNALRRLLFPFQPILDLLIFMQLCGGRGRDGCSWPHPAGGERSGRGVDWAAWASSRTSFSAADTRSHSSWLDTHKTTQGVLKKTLWLDFVPTPLSFLSTANRSGNICLLSSSSLFQPCFQQ